MTAARRWRTRWRIACAAALTATVCAVPAHSQVVSTPGASVSGPARVIDGDTLDVGGVRVRLHGIDAPERAQRCRVQGRTRLCGRDSTRALAGRIGASPVVCEARDRDQYGRVIGICRANGGDLNAWMVAERWAFAYRRYSHAYVGHETRARAEKRGVWAGDVVAPWEWRKGRRLDGGRGAARSVPRQCAIKGNISKGGTRIYHVPGGRYYARTGIDTSKGERWFCTEAEARAAGWRRSKR